MCTLPNIALNATSKDYRLFYGDWSDTDGVSKSSYDVILASETIYEPLYYSRMIDLVTFMAKEGGELWLAAKNYYFGLGGSVIGFESELLASKSDPDFRWIKVASRGTMGDGVPRQIIRYRKERK